MSLTHQTGSAGNSGYAELVRLVVGPVESEAELPPACLEEGGGLQAASSRHAPYEQSGENRFSACLEEPAKAQSRDHKY